MLIFLQLVFAALMLLSYIIGIVKLIATRDSYYWFVWYTTGLLFYIISTVFWLLQKI